MRSGGRGSRGGAQRFTRSAYRCRAASPLVPSAFPIAAQLTWCSRASDTFSSTLSSTLIAAWCIAVAPVRLSSLEVNGIRIYDVGAVVIPDKALGVNLLGMSFLSRVRRFEMANGRLVMEQ